MPSSLASVLNTNVLSQSGNCKIGVVLNAVFNFSYVRSIASFHTACRRPWAAARGLTTLHQPVESMGYEAAQLLLTRLSGFKGPARARRFEPRLVIRSTA